MLLKQVLSEENVLMAFIEPYTEKRPKTNQCEMSSFLLFTLRKLHFDLQIIITIIIIKKKKEDKKSLLMVCVFVRYANWFPISFIGWFVC